jgi:hypothetical protein
VLNITYNILCGGQCLVATYARENVFGIIGDLIPEGDVTFRRGGGLRSRRTYGRSH